MINPTSHAITEYFLPTADANATGIAPGPDGNVWFTERDGGAIGEVILTPTPAPLPPSGLEGLPPSGDPGQMTGEVAAARQQATDGVRGVLAGLRADVRALGHRRAARGLVRSLTSGEKTLKRDLHAEDSLFRKLASDIGRSAATARVATILAPTLTSRGGSARSLDRLPSLSANIMRLSNKAQGTYQHAGALFHTLNNQANQFLISNHREAPFRASVQRPPPHSR